MADTLHLDRSSSEAILNMAPSEIAAFITEQIEARQLSQIVKSLNDDMLSKDSLRREQAEMALSKLGFI